MDDNQINRAINTVAQNMTDGEPDAGFRARVMALIDSGDGPRRLGSPARVLSPLAAAALIVVAVVVMRHADVAQPFRAASPRQPVRLKPDATNEPARLRINVQYDLPSPFETQPGSNPPRGTVLKTQLHDNLSLVLESGKPVVAAQSVDPVGDRRVTVEVTATVLR